MSERCEVDSGLWMGRDTSEVMGEEEVVVVVVVAEVDPAEVVPRRMQDLREDQTTTVHLPLQPLALYSRPRRMCCICTCWTRARKCLMARWTRRRLRNICGGFLGPRYEALMFLDACASG